MPEEEESATQEPYWEGKNEQRYVTNVILFAYSVEANKHFSADILLCFVRKCPIQNVSSELTLRALSNSQNLQRKRFGYALGHMVNIVCMTHEFLNDTNNFLKGGKV